MRSDSIHVVEHAPPHVSRRSGPVVVLVHGSLDRGASFARVVRRLQDLHVITYDRRGYHRSRRAAHGRPLPAPSSPVSSGAVSSSPPVSSSPVSSSTERPGAPDPFEQHVEDLLELVGTRASVVVGHSFGGDIALAAALRAPAAIRAVGVYEPPLPWLEWWPRRARNYLADEDPGQHAEAFFRRVVSDEAWERLSARARDERRADGPALVAELSALRRGGPPFDVTQLAVPAILGRGERSLPHHRRAIEALEVLIPDAEIYEIPGAAHGAHLSHPDRFAGLVHAVVERSEA